MSTKTRTLAKSLHTITALIAVARLIAAAAGNKKNPADYVSDAAIALGYGSAADPYGLRAKAREILAAE